MRSLIVTFGLLLVSAASVAETHPMISDRMGITVGEFFADTRTKLSVGGTIDIIGIEFDFNESLGESELDEALAVEFWLRLGERWMFAAQIFEFSGAETASLSVDIPWEDVVYPAGITVTGGTGMDITRLFVGRDLVRDDRKVFGIGAGLHNLDISAFIEGEAFIADISTGVQRGTAETSGLLPNVGAWFIYAPNEKWALTSRLDWLSASVGKYDGSIVNLSAGAHYRLAKHFGVGLNYNLFHLNVGIDDTGWRGDLDVRFHGPFVNVTAYW